LNLLVPITLVGFTLAIIHLPNNFNCFYFYKYFENLNHSSDIITDIPPTIYIYFCLLTEII
jgi:hypothetical protein